MRSADLEPLLQPCKCPSTVTDGVLLSRGHFAEGACFTIRYKDRIIAKALIAARRPNQTALNAPLEMFDFPRRGGHSQGADEFCTSIGRIAEFLLDTLHGVRKVLVSTGPAGRIDAGLTIQGGHAQAAIIRQRRKPATGGGSLGLDRRILCKGRSILFRLRQAEVAS